MRFSSCSRFRKKYPWGSKDHKINNILEKTIILAKDYNERLQGTIFSYGLGLTGIMIILPSKVHRTTVVYVPIHSMQVNVYLFVPLILSGCPAAN